MEIDASSEPHFVEKIFIYPIKSLPGVSVSSLTISAAGRIEHDREFAIVDGSGRYVNAKRCPGVHAINLSAWTSPSTISMSCAALGADANSPRFDLGEQSDMAAASAWVLRALVAAGSESVTRDGIALIRASEHDGAGFADDPRLCGPTVVSASSLVAVARWYGLTVEEVAQRFRPNVVVGGSPAWWEDSLLDERSSHGRAVRFGGVHLVGALPIHRCVVPTRSPVASCKAAATPGFAATFQVARLAEMPHWSPHGRLTGGEPPFASYFLGVGCCAMGQRSRGVVAVGDRVSTGPFVALADIANEREPQLASALPQLLLERGYAIGRVAPRTRYVARALLSVLPVALGAHIVMGGQPAVVRKPTARELCIGTLHLIAIVAVAICAAVIIVRVA